MTKQAMFIKLTPAERAERESALAEMDLQIVRLDREKRQWMDDHKETRKPIEANRLAICLELESGQRWVDPQIAMPFSGKVGGPAFEFVSEDECDPDDRPALQTEKRKRGRPEKAEAN